MKKFILSLLSVYMLPLLVTAQVVIPNNEFYNIGDVYNLVNVNLTGVTADTAGPGLVWNFSTLSANGSSVITVVRDTTPGFSTSNIMITLPDGLQEHVQENSTDSYINGITDPASGITIYYTNYDASKRPFTYLSSYSSYYNVNTPSSSSAGVGNLTVTGDSYGTLMLPGATFNNVLRIKKYQSESDTVSTSPSYLTSVTKVSYLWFDGIHAAPLLEIDSVTNSVTGFSQSAFYLATTTGIRNINNSGANNYSGHLDDNGLLINGNFEQGGMFNIEMTDMAGQEVFNRNFMGSGNSQSFDINGALAPGLYIVNIIPQNDAFSGAIIKVVKI